MQEELSPHFTIRPESLPNDYSGLAALLTAVHSDWPVTTEELADEDAARDPQLYHVVFVAELAHSEPGGNRLVGVASAEHDMLSHRTDRVKLDIRVPPAWQGHGIGSRLYEILFDHLQPLAPSILQTDVWETHERALRFIKDRGFVETWQRIDSSLDVSGFDFSPYMHLEQRLNASGITITTYADLAAAPDRLIKLYELDKALWRDVPYGYTVEERTLEQFAREETLALKYITEACFIAMHGETFIGYSNLTRGDGYFMTDMTGVLPAYRGKGVATLLKLYGIHYAQAHGNCELRVTNDSVNTAMLELNAKFGFKRVGATIRFVKQIQPNPVV